MNETENEAGRARGVGDWVARGGMLLMALVVGGLWWGAEEGPAGAPEPPPLAVDWALDALRCPHDRPSSVQVHRLAQQAEARWERAKFDWSDAPRSVEGLAQARACARVAGDLSAVDRLSRRLEGWKADVERRLDRERLRLELASRRGDAPSMDRHARRLMALVSGADPERAVEAREFLQWTLRRARALRARQGALEEN